MYYKPKHFSVQELVPPAIYNKRGEKSLELIDVRIVMILDHLREKLGKPITVNNWQWGGGYSQSGLRSVEHYGGSESYFDSFSQHKYGRGADIS